jgi:hypothetical protein
VAVPRLSLLHPGQEVVPGDERAAMPKVSTTWVRWPARFTA